MKIHYKSMSILMAMSLPCLLFADVLDDLFSRATDSQRKEAVIEDRKGNYDEAVSKMRKVLADTRYAPDVLCDYVVILKRAGIYDDALKAYNLIPKDYRIPDFVQLEMAVVYYKLGKLQESSILFDKYLRKDEKDESLVAIMVEACAGSGNSDKAIRYLDARKKGMKEVPEWLKKLHARAMHGRAVELARAGKNQESLDILSGLLKENGDDQAIMSDYILVLSWDGRKDEAKKLYGEYFKDRNAPEYLVKEMSSMPVENETVEKPQEKEIKGEAAVQKIENPAEPVETARPATIPEKTAVTPAKPVSVVDQHIRSGKLNEAIDEIGKELSAAGDKRDALFKSLSEIHAKAVQKARDGKYDVAVEILDKLLETRYDIPATLADKIIIMSWAGKYDDVISMYSKYCDSYAPKPYLLDAVGTSYRRTGRYAEAIECYEKSLSLNPDNPDAVKGKVFSLIGARRNSEAHTFIQKEMEKYQDPPNWLKMLTCEAYIVEGSYDKAGNFLRSYLKTNPNDADAKKMMIDVLIQQKTGLKEAMGMVEELIAADPSNPDLLFLKVTLLQLSREYLAAYALNQKILSINKFYRPSINTKYHILLDIKAAILANQMLKESGDDVSYAVKKRIMGDLAAEQLSWKDYKKALEILDENIRTYDKYKNIPEASEDAEKLKIRARFDRILALFQAERMQDLIKEYENLKEDGVDTPSWLRLNVASAYLYCRQPDTALSMYREIHDEMKRNDMDKYPDNYLVLQGIYACLVEIEDQRGAYDILEILEKETPSFARPNGVYVQNPEKMELAVEKGWWYIYNDQLSYADEYLTGLVESAPNNTVARTALAYVHYYRGWPRLALEDFQISTALDPNDRSAQVGLAYTLNENDEYEKARTLAAELAKQYPADLDVKKLLRSFELQEKRTLTIDSNYSNEGNFSDGSGVTIRLDQPIYPDRKVYVESLWLFTSQPKESNQEGKRRNIFRGAVGFDWRLNSYLWIFGEASMDYHAENPGFMAGLRFKPTDSLTLSGFYNSYTLNMPPKALLYDKKGQEANISAEYRYNEDLIFNGGFSNVWVSDGNINQTYSWKVDKGIYSTAYWKFRASVEGSTTTNTKFRDSEYYAPKYYTSIYFVPMVEHLWYRSYETSIVDRLFLGIGPHWEKDFTCKSQYYARYEQEYVLTDYFSFKVGGKIGKERYGDDNPCGWGLYGSITFKF